MVTTDNWRGRVYKVHVESGLSTKDWRSLRAKIITRDKDCCQRCLKRLKRSRLSVHHIIPRADGGSNLENNLITLCHKCHDFVELKKFKTRAEIIGSYDDPAVVNHSKEEIEETPAREESFERPEWHKFVYGGVKRSRFSEKAIN